MPTFFQKIGLRVYAQWVLRYIRQERTFEYAGLRIRVPAGVFHPGVFFTTTRFIEFLQAVHLQGKSVLDVGTGSGMLALFAAGKGGIVTAIDINPQAVETCVNNAALNGVPVEVVESDLFDQLPHGATYDYILANPPFYAATPKDDAARAFFAGENLEYFEKFFSQLPECMHRDTKTWMILSLDCDLEKIRQIASRHGLEHTMVSEKSKWGKGMVVLEWKVVSRSEAMPA